MLRWKKDPMTVQIPLFGYMYYTRKYLVNIAHHHGLKAWTTGSGPDQILHMEGDAGEFKDVLDHVEKIEHYTGPDLGDD